MRAILLDTRVVWGAAKRRIQIRDLEEISRPMSKPLALGCALLFRSAASFACATAPPAGEEVKPAEEEALIVWDSVHHVEHFIRRAGFRTSAQSFGFLVPTPSKPELTEIDAGIF